MENELPRFHGLPSRTDDNYITGTLQSIPRVASGAAELEIVVEEHGENAQFKPPLKDPILIAFSSTVMADSIGHRVRFYFGNAKERLIAQMYDIEIDRWYGP